MIWSCSSVWLAWTLSRQSCWIQAGHGAWHILKFCESTVATVDRKSMPNQCISFWEKHIYVGKIYWIRKVEVGGLTQLKKKVWPSVFYFHPTTPLLQITQIRQSCSIMDSLSICYKHKLWFSRGKMWPLTQMTMRRSLSELTRLSMIPNPAYHLLGSEGVEVALHYYRERRVEMLQNLIHKHLSVSVMEWH